MAAVKPDNEVREERGTIQLAQESRFRLQTRDGRSLLLFLGKGSRVSMAGIRAMAERGSVVLVRYRGQPIMGAVALEITPTVWPAGQKEGEAWQARPQSTIPLQVQ